MYQRWFNQERRCQKRFQNPFQFQPSYKKLLGKLLFLRFGKWNEFKVQTPKHTSNLTDSLTLRSEVPFKTMKMNV